MGVSSLYMPPGYVATRWDLVWMFLSCLLMFGLGFMMWSELVEVPPVPQKLVLRSAYATQSLSISKAKASLYFNVVRESGEYNYKVEFFHSDTGELNIYKFKALWVAVDLGSDNQFVWAVYDDEFRLLMSRQQIEEWARSKNVGSYFMVVYSCLAIMYLVFNMVRCGIWNRYSKRERAGENRRG